MMRASPPFGSGDEFAKQRLIAGADAVQSADAGEQGIEERRPYAASGLGSRCIRLVLFMFHGE